MKTVEIARNEKFVWPRECAKCSSTKEITFVTATGGKINSVSPALGGVHFENELVELTYPVCKSHAFGASIANFVTRNTAPLKFLRGLFYLYALALIPMMLMLPVYLAALATGKSNPEAPSSMMILMLIVGAIGAAMFYFVKSRPIRVVSVGNSSIRIGFSNDQYATKFSVANHGAVT